MIVDLRRFLERRRPLWEELDRRLRAVEADPFARIGLDDIRRLHDLYEQVAADLADARELAVRTEVRDHLEALVARAYALVYALEETPARFRPLRWLAAELPQAVRRRARAGVTAAAAFGAGVLLGGAALLADPSARSHLMPFDHLQLHPAERVLAEERQMRAGGDLAGEQAGSFAAMLLVNNVRVSLLAAALGMTFGAGTLALLLYNGVVLGAVCVDFVVAGQTAFLAGWLLPHGSVEIPAILLGGQAGLVLASALLGDGDRRRRVDRLAAAGPDILSLLGGAAVLLVWAAGLEAFLSQYHEPILPYGLKIAIGLMQTAGLAAWLAFGGRWAGRPAP